MKQLKKECKALFSAKSPS